MLNWTVWIWTAWSFNYVWTNDWCLIELLVIHSNTSNHLTVCKRMCLGLFLKKLLTKCVYKLCIYIYCHPQTDCLDISQLFSMAGDVGRLKLGSKPAQLYVRLSIRPLDQQVYHVGKGIIRHYVATTAASAFVCLHCIPYRIPECSIRSKSLALCEGLPKIPSPECSTPMGERIYVFNIHV